jgi:transposase InsO family protein
LWRCGGSIPTGARKLAVLLARQGIELPSSTVHRVLLRHGLVRDQDRHAPATTRFEREQPNELWQMDFKGPKNWPRERTPLSVLDDCSRYLIALGATARPEGRLVQRHLEQAFEECGLPEAMLMDHGIPWWQAQSFAGATYLSLWLMRQGIALLFSGGLIVTERTSLQGIGDLSSGERKKQSGDRTPMGPISAPSPSR